VQAHVGSRICLPNGSDRAVHAHHLLDGKLMNMVQMPLGVVNKEHTNFTQFLAHATKRHVLAEIG